MAVCQLVETVSRRSKLVYAGVTEGLTYIQPFVQDRFHCEPLTARSQAAIGLDDVPKVGSWELGADMLVAAVPRALARLLPPERALVLPFRVHMIADASVIPSSQERKRQRRRVRRYDYDYEISRDASDFDWFYDRLHLPTMRARHGSRMRSVTKQVARRTLFDRGFVLFVRAAGQRVAGILCQVDAATQLCNARLVGWLDGDKVHLDREALKTANHFLIEWAPTAGLARIDFQGCEPFLSKGTYQSKRHLARAALPPSPLNDLAVWIYAAQDTPATRNFLAANPPILLGAEGSLQPCYPFDDERPARTDLGYNSTGLAAAIELSLDTLLGEAIGARRDGVADSRPGAQS